MKWIAACALACTLHAPVHAETAWSTVPGQHAETFEGTQFQLYLPPLKAGERLPLLVFLHGSGERGDDVEKVKVHGPPKLAAQGRQLPFIVISPLLGKDQDWDAARIMALIDAAQARLPVDAGRIYLTGLSRGGHATWNIAAQYPQRFAAIAPVAGRGKPEQACALREVPVWSFHGDADGVVPIAGNQAMVDAVRACGGKPRFTVYPGVGHDSWTASYDNPELYAWLLKYRIEAP